MEIKGLEELLSDLDLIEKEMPGKKKKFLSEIAAQTVGATKKVTPVDTGALRNTWHYKYKRDVGKYEALVYNNTKYAPHVEWGHRTRGGGFVQGRYMLRKGLNFTESRIEKDLRAFLKDVVKP